jgi:hypothetical protein
MKRPEAETNEPVVPVAAGWWAPARRLLPEATAILFILFGGAILASNLGLLAPAAQRAINIIWPAGLVLAGLGLILVGGALWDGEMAGFMLERGEAEEADLVAAAGTADLRIEAMVGAGALAAGELPRPKQPKLVVRDRRATVRLEPLWGLPELGGARWKVALARGLPWRLDLGSSTGNLDLNLADLSLAALRLRSTFGDVDLTLPADGCGDVDLGLAFGECPRGWG